MIMYTRRTLRELRAKAFDAEVQNQFAPAVQADEEDDRAPSTLDHTEGTSSL